MMKEILASEFLHHLFFGQKTPKLETFWTLFQAGLIWFYDNRHRYTSLVRIDSEFIRKRCRNSEETSQNSDSTKFFVQHEPRASWFLGIMVEILRTARGARLKCLKSWGSCRPTTPMPLHGMRHQKRRAKTDIDCCCCWWWCCWCFHCHCCPLSLLDPFLISSHNIPPQLMTPSSLRQQEFFESYLWCKKYEANLSAKVNECVWGTQEKRKDKPSSEISSFHASLGHSVELYNRFLTAFSTWATKLLVFEMVLAAAFVSHSISATHLGVNSVLKVIAMLWSGHGKTVWECASLYTNGINIKLLFTVHLECMRWLHKQLHIHYIISI